MSESRFDENIKKKLQDLEQDYDPMSWDLLNEKLDAGLSDTKSDKEFDNQVSDSLKKYRELPNHSDWLIMKEELEIIQERKEKVIVAKFIELVVILLLVLTFNQYRTLTFPQDRVNQFYAQTIEQLNQNAETIQAVVEIDPVIEKSLTAEISQLRLSQTRTKFDIITDIQPLSLSGISNIKLRSEQLTAETKTEESFVQNKMPLFVSFGLDRLPLLELKSFETKPELPVIQPVQVFALEKRRKSMNGWSIGIPVSIDANFVNSEFNFNILKSQVEYGLSSTSVGLSAAYRFNGLELETGIDYSAKKYAPGLIRNYKQATSSGNTLLEEQLELVTLRQFQIPIQLRVYASPNEKISFYGTIGLAANFILDTDYELKKQTISANLRPSFVLNQKVLDLGEPPLGLFQGGTLEDNFYVTSIIGLGIQQYFSNGLGWYIQPQYQHSLARNISETASEINSLSIEVGIKYKL